MCTFTEEEDEGTEVGTPRVTVLTQCGRHRFRILALGWGSRGEVCIHTSGTVLTVYYLGVCSPAQPWEAGAMPAPFAQLGHRGHLKESVEEPAVWNWGLETTDP